MKYINYLQTIIILSLIFISCDLDPCDTGYTQVKNNDGSSYCLPDYVVGEKQDFEKGNVFYHKKHGLVSFNKGEWYTHENKILTDIELNDQ